MIESAESFSMRKAGAPELLHVHRSSGHEMINQPFALVAQEAAEQPANIEASSTDNKAVELAKKYGVRMALIAGLTVFSVIAIEITHDMQTTSSETID